MSHLKVCKHCGEKFEGINEKFCDNSCRDSYIVLIEKRVQKAVKDDPSHTRKLSHE